MTTTADRFTVSYILEAPTYEDAKKMAFSVQVEQTIEFPYDLVTNSFLKEEIVGQLLSLEPVDEGHYRAVISFAASLTSYEVTQFLNVVFGNSSLQPGIWVESIDLCPSLYEVFKGPRWGIKGLREYLEVPERPLLQAVIKPLGSSTETLAEMCLAYAKGGVDVIKDDHGITNQKYAPFTERVKACVEAIREGSMQSGSKTIYAANVTADGSETIERAYLAKELGADALMVAPGLVGFGVMHALASDSKLNMPIISHPALSGGFTMAGTSGISMPLWFGTLNRLFGADMSIFVSYGGRFTFTKETCQDIVRRSLTEAMPIAAACPAPGGGVTEKRLPELMEAYGRDVMYLVGGDMFRRSDDLETNVKVFLELLESGIKYAPLS